ncbi:MAG: DUF779 domain-containing protein [Actinomycetota bacterium]
MNVSVTSEAETIVRRVRDDGRENLIMVLGTGCCDSTSPFLYDNYLPEPDSQPVGVIDGVQIVAPKWLADLYPGNEGLVVDVDAGVLNDSFSLESEYDCRFTLRVPARPEGR